ncbi:LADA_0E00804g1_1 [Lachancea dasiensis]|uniref:LADA_0E00804g1_1 n=1 Tax=Lachancea dasiensis TaxID=1072105 RepID=A0A1G4JA92_9SACH|nr:LADA_0E00804g1_1 [Lachancea dasiensis]
MTFSDLIIFDQLTSGLLANWYILMILVLNAVELPKLSAVMFAPSNVQNLGLVNPGNLSGHMNPINIAGPTATDNTNHNSNNSDHLKSASGNLNATPANQVTLHALDDPNVYHWICQLTYGPNKEQALLELGRKREQYEDLAIVLWSSFGVVAALLSEITSVYPMLSPPVLSNQLSNRVCNALVLLQCVASHPETKTLFLQAHIPLLLFPFLNTTSRQRTFEYLRLTSLGVIGALVKNDSAEVIAFLLRTDIIPLCLRIMESSSELSKTVAIFILQKILLDDAGLQYICATPERFHAVSQVLTYMVDQLTLQQTPGRLLKHVVRCYLRLSDNLEARRLLKQVLPRQLKDNTFGEVLRDDLGTKRCLAQLLLTLNED